MSLLEPDTGIGATEHKISEGGENPEKKSPHLSISAHVVVQLGEELVTDVEQALLELAKNAYDADSEICRIEIDPDWVLVPEDPAYDLLLTPLEDEDEQQNDLALTSETAKGSEDRESKSVGRVRIRDSGKGLTQDVLENGWLRISASLKRSKPGQPKGKTARGRTLVGDKGLGRLATMKIAQVLRMKTAVEGETVWRTVTFSWSHFTHGRTLEEVPVIMGIDNSEPVDGEGTVVELIGLHEPSYWQDKNYIEKHLIPNLSSLINPFLTHDHFEISLKTNEQSYELHSLDNEIFNLASAKFDFDWDGEVLTRRAYFAPSLFRGSRGDRREEEFADLFSKDNIPLLQDWLKRDPKLTDQGLSFNVDSPWFFSISDRLPGIPFPSDPLFPGGVDAGPFTAKLYYFMFHQNVQDKLQQAGVSAARLQAMTQVAIFRDGFRVRAQKDWLRIAQGMTSGSFYGLRPNNTIGYFALSNEHNPLLIEKSDREGFVDNLAYRGFMSLGLRCRDFADRALDTVRIAVRRFETRTPTEETTHQGLRSLSKQAKETRERVQTGVEKLQSRLQDTQKALAEARGVAITQGVSADSVAVEKLRVVVEQTERKLADVSNALVEVDNHVKQHTRLSARLAELNDDDRDYAERLLDASAVGLTARALSHELHSHVRQLRDGVSRVHDANKLVKNPQISDGVRVLTSATRELTKTVAAIDPLLPGTRSIKETLELRKFISEYVEARQGAATRVKAQFVCVIEDNDHDFRFRFSRSRFTQILENLFQNSLYWLQHGGLPDRNIRKIEVRVTRDGFVWGDSGPGVRPSLESSIFDAYVSDKPKSEGSGLGLHVISTFLELERCSIRLGTVRNSLGRRFEFVVDLLPARAGSQQQQLLN